MDKRVPIRTVFTVLLCSVVVAACGSSNSDSEDTGGVTSNPAQAREPAYAADLSNEIERTMKDGAIPGAVVLVRSPELGDWSATFGTGTVGRDEPMSLGDHFRVGSNTKTMTGTVVLQLVQEGKLSLDNPVSKYMPGVPNGDNITIAQLLEMRSGLYSYSTNEAFNATLDREPKKVWTPEQLLAIAFAQPPNFAPAEGFEYSNTNTVLLGLIIEKLTGVSASEAFRQRLFEPLRLENTSLPERHDWSIPRPHPQGYMFSTNLSTTATAELPANEKRRRWRAR